MQTLKYTNQEKIIMENLKEDVLYLTYPLLEQTGIVKHGFSTRIGGVSEGVCSTMNLSFSRGDKEEAVRENYRRMAKALEIAEDSFVFSSSIQENTSGISSYILFATASEIPFA